MDAFKRFSLALMAAVVVAGATPAFSQTRDTRPTEPDRPTIEQGEKGGGGSDRAEPERVNRLPQPSPGTACEAHADGNGFWEVTVTNETGKTIPAGTVLTLYLQPGNVQKTFKLETDWYSGTGIDVTVKAGEFELGARCVVKVMPKRADTGGRGLPQPEGEVPWYAQGPATFRCIELHVITDDAVVVRLFNDGATAIPAGTKIVFQLPDGQWYTLVLEEDWEVNTDMSVHITYTEALEKIWTDKWPGCPYVKVETGYNGPAVDEQGSVPQVDPSKVP